LKPNKKIKRCGSYHSYIKLQTQERKKKRKIPCWLDRRIAKAGALAKEMKLKRARVYV
jgi:hypothetical protein